MKPFLRLLAAASVLSLGIPAIPASAQQPIRIGIPTAIQLQVGRDTQNAAKLDPTQAGKAYYNLGAILINSGQNDAAKEAFKTAIDKDPSYADAYYQNGVSMLAGMTVAKDGKVTFPPGNKEAFEKYLELKPQGANAAEARDFITQMGGTIQTEYKNPSAKDKKPAPAKKK